MALHHGQPQRSTFYGDEAVEYRTAFFDHFLKGADNGMDIRPAVRLEVREALEQGTGHGFARFPRRPQPPGGEK